jgi:hypothetical protein
MMNAKHIPEDLVVFIWQQQLFNHANLQSKSGKQLSILNQGVRQFDSGPDFSNATIQIEQLKLVGNIEIHSNDTDWEIHNHGNDAAYNSVVLHVVWESKNDFTILENKSTVEILELKSRVDTNLVERYKSLMQQQTKVLCEKFAPVPDSFIFNQFLTKLSIERLQRKVSDIEVMCTKFKNDWDQIAFIYLARYLGGNLNNDAFQHLSESIPVKVLFRNLNSPKSVEAILFGQSGLLDREINDAYFNILKTEYKYQKRLHNLVSINGASFKFSKIRPAAFPSFRLAQLAAIISSEKYTFDKIIACKSVADFESTLKLKEHLYWQDHYDFNNRQKRKHSFAVGKSTLQMLSINVFIPLLFAYGKYKNEESFCELSIQYLEQVAAEKNSVIAQFRFLAPKYSNALETQGLIQLKTAYCNKKRCLDCNIGNAVLRN